MSAIFKREFVSYFHTVIGELFIGLNILIFGFFFVEYNLLGLSTNLNGTLYNTAFIGLLFLIPILCMRSFSEERRQKTDQLIMTAPVSVGGIVAGKFFALAAVFSIPTAVICLLPPLMSRFGEIPWLWNYADILDYWLYGLMMIAICVFISSLTENQIVCVVLSVAVLLGCNIINSLLDNVSVAWVKTLLQSTIDFNGRLMTIYLGSFDLTSIIFFISVTVLFLFLTTQVLQKRRYTVSKANLSVTAYSTLTILLVIAVVVGVNFLALKIPADIREVDLTESRIYTITDESKKIAADVTDDVTFYFLAQENDEGSNTKDKTLERILKNYIKANPYHLHLEYIDPTTNTKFYQNYSDTDPGYSGVIVVDETSGRNKVINYSDMYLTSIDYTTYQQVTAGYDMEGQITNALQYVTLSEDGLVHVYTTTKHGEQTLDSYYKKILENDSIVTADLELLNADTVPADAELIIINAPATDFAPGEVSVLKTYMEQGGNLLIVTSPDLPSSEPMTNFNELLDWYGVSLEEGVVLDATQGNYYATFGTPAYLLPNLSSSDEISSPLANTGLQTVFLPEAQAILSKETDGVSFNPILTTSDQSYLSTDASQKNPQSFTVGARAVRTLDSGSSTLVLYTCGLVFTNQVDELIAGMNQRLFANTIDSLTELATDFVTIPSKPAESYLTIPMTVGNFLTVIGFVFVAAIAVIIAGIVIWAVRRKK